jgi:hypothetical protein
MALAGARLEEEDYLPPLRTVNGMAATDPILSGIWTDVLCWAWQEERPSARQRVIATVDNRPDGWFVGEFDGVMMLTPCDPPRRATVKVATAPEAERLTAAAAWLRQRTLELMRLGVAQKVSSRKWRKLDPTPKQLEFLKQLAKRVQPCPVERIALRVAWASLVAADRGYVSDFITVLKHWGKR